MNKPTNAAIETATAWVSSWDEQQETYIPGREARFAFLTALVTAVGGVGARVLDLGCGPGSLLLRLRRSLPEALLVGVDFDPVLLGIAATLVSPNDQNTTLLDADLRRDWVAPVAEFGPYDVILSCTALHWLSDNEITRTYANSFTLLRPGGLILNADTMLITGGPAMTRLLDTALGTTSDSSAWTRWWHDLESVPAYEPQFAERTRRLRAHPRAAEFITDAHWHQHALRAAGFADTAVVWRMGPEAVVAGRRPNDARLPANT